jgi:hypothetical protein
MSVSSAGNGVFVDVALLFQSTGLDTQALYTSGNLLA